MVKFREDFIAILRGCLDEHREWHRIERCFRQQVDEENDEEVEDARPLVFAFGYMLVARRREELRERVGVFGAQWELEGSIFPPRLPEIDDQMLGLWAEYASATTEYPAAASRLNDLLWVRRYSERPVHHAQTAADSYLALAEFAESMDLVDCIIRALEIAAEIGDRPRVERAVNAAVAVATTEIDNREERRPGIPLNLLEAIVDLRPEVRPGGLEELIDAAGERYGNDPYIAQSVSELKVELAKPGEKADLQQQQIQRWRDEAERSQGLLGYARLQQALALARTYGFTETAQEILATMQAISIEDLDLKPITAEIELPRHEIDAVLESYATDCASWDDAFRRFGSEGPPSGDAKENEELVRELAEKYPLGRIFPTQILGAHASPVVAAAGDEEHDQLDVAKHEAMKIRVGASIGVEILDRIGTMFGPFGRNELTSFFTTEFIDEAVAARIADAVVRFYEGDIDGSIHIMLPQLEAVIRSVAAQIGMVVIRTPVGPTPGGVVPLHALLRDLKGQIDESWRRYLMNSLTATIGVNLRNQVSHGLYGPATREDAEIAIHIACHLRLWGIKRADSDGESSRAAD